MLLSLVGMPGGGKSTVGRQLARHLGWDFLDSDSEIEQALGSTIADYFAKHGEESFRDVEERVIAKLCAERSRPAVLATGGGAVLREANRNALRAAGVVIYLRASLDELYRRLRNDRQRPLLQVPDPRGALRDLLRVRDPLYRSAAHYVIDTGRPSVPVLVNRISMQMELGGHLHLPAAPAAD